MNAIIKKERGECVIKIYNDGKLIDCYCVDNVLIETKNKNNQKKITFLLGLEGVWFGKSYGVVK